MDYQWINKGCNHRCMIGENIKLLIEMDYPTEGSISCDVFVHYQGNWHTVNGYIFKEKDKTLEQCKEYLIINYKAWIRDWVEEKRTELESYIAETSAEINAFLKEE